MTLDALVPWNRDALHKSRSAAPGSQGATTKNIGHIRGRGGDAETGGRPDAAGVRRDEPWPTRERTGRRLVGCVRVSARTRPGGPAESGAAWASAGPVGPR